MKRDDVADKRKQYEQLRQWRERQLQVVETEKRKSEPCPYCGFMNMICKCPRLNQS